MRPTRTTETGSRDDRPHTGATSLQTCLVFSAPRPRPSKSPGIHRKNSGLRPSDPGVRSSAGLGGGGGSLERTRLARRQANKRRILDGSLLCPASNSLTGSGGVSWRAASVPPHRRISCCPRASRIPATRSPLLAPADKGVGRQLGTVVETEGGGPPVQRDEFVENPDHAPSRNRPADIDRQTFAIPLAVERLVQGFDTEAGVERV